MDTLVLSPTFELINQVSWQRAIALWVMGEVEILSEYDDWVVRSVTLEIRVPAVIRFLAGAIGWRKRGARFSRENVFARDKGRCQYCNKAVSRAEATFEHVIPRSRGGTTRWENIVIACLPCNQRKGSRTPAEAGMKLRATPIRPTTLPETLRITLPAGKMPEPWKRALRSIGYWHAALDEE